LITHEHFDHVEPDRLAAVAKANPNLRVWGPKAVIDGLANKAEFADRLTAVGPGETFTAGGMSVRTFGGQHAVIHLAIPTIANVGYLIADGVYHPGDAYTVPTSSVEALLVPINAPWSKVSETIDFTVAVRAPKAFQIHDSLLGDVGRGAYEGMLKGQSDQYGFTTFQHLDPRESVEL
jgi:L-ascorbate metabolism protein UlaG (beta-lactamase superfamily)